MLSLCFLYAVIIDVLSRQSNEVSGQRARDFIGAFLLLRTETPFSEHV